MPELEYLANKMLEIARAVREVNKVNTIAAMASRLRATEGVYSGVYSNESAVRGAIDLYQRVEDGVRDA